MKCPKCKKKLSTQFDTEDQEAFWHCFNCEQSYLIDGVTKAVYMTAVEDPEAQ